MKWTAQLAALSAHLPARERLVGGAVQGLMSAAAAILAYLPTRALGLREGYWASITAVAVVQIEVAAVRNSARDQFAGAAIGGLIGASLIMLVGQDLAGYALAIVTSMVLCWLLQMASASHTAGGTATIILLVPHQSAIGWAVISRITEVGWGVTVAIATVWLINRAKSTR